MKLKIRFNLILLTSLTLSLNSWGQSDPIPYAPFFPEHACYSKYHFIKNDKKFETTYVHGYSDDGEGKDTLDIYYQNKLIQGLTVACGTSGKLNCGFKRSPDDAEKFQRFVIGLDGNPVPVFFLITHSSLTSVNKTNLNNPKQEYQSQHAKEMFGKGLKKSHVVIYDGHSRDGGGPDFSPPKTLSNGHTNYDWYRSHRVGLQYMVNTLTENENDPQLIGLFSCSSINHFYNSISRAAPSSGFIGTNEALLFSDTSSTILIDDYLNFRCLSKKNYPEPVHFKKWWTTEENAVYLNEDTWKTLYETRANNLYINYLKVTDPELKGLYYKELDKLSVIPSSLKTRVLNHSRTSFSNMVVDQYFIAKWQRLRTL
jgi:hypothetical protein